MSDLTLKTAEAVNWDQVLFQIQKRACCVNFEFRADVGSCYQQLLSTPQRNPAARPLRPAEHLHIDLQRLAVNLASRLSKGCQKSGYSLVTAFIILSTFKFVETTHIYCGSRSALPCPEQLASASLALFTFNFAGLAPIAVPKAIFLLD